MRIDLALCLPRDTASIAVVRHIAGCALSEIGVEAGCVADIELAVSEACANVVEHAVADDEYEVRVELDDDRCEIRVIDIGGGFDSTLLLGPMPAASNAQGRGLALMKALVDRIDFVSEPEQGTIVHLVKRLDLGRDVAVGGAVVASG
jgi:serine/threonine-protein kinase RsbW